MPNIMDYLNRELSRQWEKIFDCQTTNELFTAISNVQGEYWVWVIDEIENYNPEFLNDFLHGIRKLYHSRSSHSLKSVVFREKDKDGKFTSIKEAGLIYSFETFLAAFLQQAGGFSYREADAGLGKSDLVLNVRGKEFLFETKKYSGITEFGKGKNQIAYYARSLGLKKAIYLVFAPNHLNYPKEVKEDFQTVKGVEVSIFLVTYDEKKDF